MFKKPENIVFIIISICIISYKFFFHEMWKDEWQAWFVASEMPLKQMFDFLFYDGHPSVWYLYLKAWNIFSPIVESEYLLQIAHSVVFVAFLYFFICKLKFPLLWKIVFISGYFFWFEYGIINRGYAMLMLFSTLLIWFIQNNEKKYWLWAIVIFLLCNTEIFGVFFAASVVLYFLLKYFYFEKNMYNKTLLNVIISSFLFGALCFYLTMKPASGMNGVTFYYFNNFNFNQILYAIQGCWTNTFYIELFGDLNSVGYSFNAVIIGIILLISTVIFFRKEKSIMLVWFLFGLMFTLFTAAFYIGGVRQWGILLFTFFLFVILYCTNQKLQIWQIVFLISISIFQFIHSARIFVFEIQSPFSNSKLMGEYIKENIDEKSPIIFINKAFAVPVSGYANRKFITLPDEKTFSIFRWREPMYFPTVTELYNFMLKNQYRKIYFIHNKPLPFQDYAKLKPVAKFDEKSIKDEKYYMYSLSL